MEGKRVTIEDGRRLPIFGQVEDRDLALIAHGLERESFAAGDFIFRQGAAGHHRRGFPLRRL